MSSETLPKDLHYPPGQRLFLFTGTDVAKLTEARRQVTHALIPFEEREHNYTEITPNTNRLQPLAKVGPNAMDELATPTFFPDQRRVVFLSHVQELFGKSGGTARKSAKSKKKKAESESSGAKGDPQARFIDFLQGEFQKMNSVLIIEAAEDEDKRRKVDQQKSPLAAYLMREARVYRYNEPILRFDFEDALLGRDAARAIALYREWINNDTRFQVLSVITDAVRLLLQAALEAHLSRGGKRQFKGVDITELIPNTRKDLNGIHQRRGQKYRAAARNYNVLELTEALMELPALKDAFMPPPGSTFVRDLDAAVEAYILRLCA
jgi:DNA polymerase III delta subunit